MAVTELGWGTIKKIARSALAKKELGQTYDDRLDFEFDEIEKQGANRYWEDIINDRKKFASNPNGLLLPWLLNRLSSDANIDPLEARVDPLVLTTKHSDISEMIDKIGHIPFDVVQDNDKPDIDIDCLPAARDKIKEYAAERYGRDNVASVGTWQTYLFKQAVGDAYLAYHRMDHRTSPGESETGNPNTPAVTVTTQLPDDVNELKDLGYGVCKGKIKEDGQERECGHKYNGLAGDNIGQLVEDDGQAVAWLKNTCPVCGSRDTETPTIGSLFGEHKPLLEFALQYPHVIDMALRLVGRIRNAGKHAGAIIIADRNLFGNVPMLYDQKAGQWVSLWTEGHSTQLSKFGYNKWDILGLKNLEYIYECCKMVSRNHGISFRPPGGGSAMDGLLRYVDPTKDQAGLYWDQDGNEVKISLNDEAALELADEQKTDGVFQFDTDLAKRILSNGVKRFQDLLIYNAMGHPGPMAMIPEYVKRRDDETEAWRTEEHPMTISVLEETLGVIVFQEQLTGLWQTIAGFTGPESQDARKAVAKKWRDKLKPVRQKWIDGASKHLGEKLSTFWWDERMETFGRYAFNRSHAVSYCLWAYKCLWLKAHYPEEWWACVMSSCHQQKLPRYMSSSRADGIKFGSVDANHMTTKMTAHTGMRARDGKGFVALGLISLKKVGMAIAEQFADDDEAPLNDFADIDSFIDTKGKNKILMERLIKLGSFVNSHPNIRATWMWYVHKYCTGEIRIPWSHAWEKSDGMQHGFINLRGLVADPEKQKTITVAQLKQYHRMLSLEADGWTDDTIEVERQRQLVEFMALKPKKKPPKKIKEFKPKPDESRDRIMSFYPVDYTLEEILAFEKEFLGYHWHSPVDLYRIESGRTVEHAKLTGVLEAVVVDKRTLMTGKNRPYVRLVVNDSIRDALVMIWESELGLQDSARFKKDAGIRLKVEYDSDRNSFTLARGTVIEQLWTKRGWSEYQDGELPEGSVA